MQIDRINELVETNWLATPPAQSDQKLLTLADASQLLPRFNDRRVSVVSLWRWAVRGYHGVHLNHLRIGRRLVVTMAWLNQFFLEVAKLDAEVHGPSNFKPKPKRRRRHRHSDVSRQQELDKAREILIRAKILQEPVRS